MAMISIYQDASEPWTVRVALRLILQAVALISQMTLFCVLSLGADEACLPFFLLQGRISGNKSSCLCQKGRTPEIPPTSSS